MDKCTLYKDESDNRPLKCEYIDGIQRCHAETVCGPDAYDRGYAAGVAAERGRVRGLLRPDYDALVDIQKRYAELRLCTRQLFLDLQTRKVCSDVDEKTARLLRDQIKHVLDLLTDPDPCKKEDE